MEGEELGGTFVVAVDELGLSGLWATVRELVESRMPLQGLVLPNKVGKQVAVPRLPLMYVLSTDKRLLRLKQYSHSPVTWFRNPHAHLLLVSTADAHEYKTTVRPQLRRTIADMERDWAGAAVGAEWVVCYIRPFELESADRNARKVYEKLIDDFGTRRRERVVRLDVPLQMFNARAAQAGRPGGSAGVRQGDHAAGAGVPYAPLSALGGPAGGLGSASGGGGGIATGLDELCAGLRDALRAGFEARTAAYVAEVRRLLNERRDPHWSFTTLYLVKDSFAIMLEGAGLWEDAFQEYVELETVYLDSLDNQPQHAQQHLQQQQHAASMANSQTFTVTTVNTQQQQQHQHQQPPAGLVVGSSLAPVSPHHISDDAAQQRLQAPAAAGAAAAAAALQQGEHNSSAPAVLDSNAADFGLVGVDGEDVATLLSRTWHSMRRLVLWKKRVQEFHFRQYLFAAQARVLLRLGRPLDVAERGLVFVQNFLPLLAAHEAAGHARPWLKEAWAFSACMALLAIVAGPEGGAGGGPAAAAAEGGWDALDALARASASSPSGPAAQAALRALAAAAAATAADSSAERSTGSTGGAAAGAAKSTPAGAAAHRSTESDRRLQAHAPHALAVPNSSSSSSSVMQHGRQEPSAQLPILVGRQWELDGSMSPHVMQQQQQQQQQQPQQHKSHQRPDGKSAESIANDDDDDDVPPLDMGLLCGQAAAPGTAGLLLHPEQRWELMERLHNCLIGHLYHLARGQLLRLGSGLQLADASGDGSSSCSIGRTGILHVGRITCSAPPGGEPSLGSKAAHGGSTGVSEGQHLGALQPRLAVQLGELLSMPLCGFSQQVSKHADGSSGPLTYEVHTPRLGLDEDPLAAALMRADSQSTPYTHYGSNCSSPTKGPGDAASAGAATATATASGCTTGGGGMLERLRRGGSTGSSGSLGELQTGGTSSASTPGHSRFGRQAAAAAAAGAPAPPTQLQQQQQRQEASADGGASADLARADSSTSLTTIHINSSGDGAMAAAAAAAVAAVSVADQELVRPAAPPALSPADSLALRDVSLPRVMIHVRGTGPQPGTATSSSSSAAAAGASSGVVSSPRRPIQPTQRAAVGGQAAAAAARGGRPGPSDAQAAAAVLGWVGDWRLQLALRSSECFEELLLALTRRAARSYAHAGRLRSSALLCADVALLALQRGRPATASRLLERVQAFAAAEGWTLLQGKMLPRLLACQRLALDPTLPFTALALLSLPPGAADPEDRDAALEELLSSLGAAGVVSPLPAAGAAAGPPPALAPESVQLATHSALQLLPCPGTFSLFFGSEAATPHLRLRQQNQPAAVASAAGAVVPALSPPALRPRPGAVAAAAASKGDSWHCCQRGGAALLQVGDGLELQVDVYSSLPGPLLLQRPVLCLALLYMPQRTATANSISSSSSGSSSGSGAHARLAGAVPQHVSTAAAAAGTDSPRPAGNGWQEGEELRTSRLIAATSVSIQSSNNTRINTGCDVTTRLLPAAAGVLLAPGVSRLTFQLAPQREGLYCLRQLRGAVGTCGQLLVGLPPSWPPPAGVVGVHQMGAGASAAASGRASSATAAAPVAAAVAVALPAGAPSAAAAASAGGAGAGADALRLGGIDAAGAVVGEVAVAHVVAAAPRLSLTPVVPGGGALPAGRPGWLGVLLVPRHDAALRRARLHVAPASLLSLVYSIEPGGGGHTPAGGDVIFPSGTAAAAAASTGLVGGGVSGDTVSAAGFSSTEDITSALAALGAGSATGGRRSVITGSSSSISSRSGRCWVFVQSLQPRQPVGSCDPAAAAAEATAAPGAVSSPPDAPPACSGADGRWLPVRRGCIALDDVLGEDGAMDAPLLLWLQVMAGSPALAPATVHVTAGAAAAPAPVSSTSHASSSPQQQQQQQQQQQPLPHSRGASPQQSQQQQKQQKQQKQLWQPAVKAVPSWTPLLPGQPADAAATAGLALQLEYMGEAGVWRSHNTCLCVQLQQPVRVAAAAITLPDGGIAVQVSLTLDAAERSGLLLTDAALRPQYGLLLRDSNTSSSSSSNSCGAASLPLPLQLLPAGCARLTFVLDADPGDRLTGSFEADGSSQLLLTFSPLPGDTSSTAGSCTDSRVGVTIPHPESGEPLPLPLPPHQQQQQQQSLCTPTMLRLPLWLQFSQPPVELPTLSATLLGPFHGRLGKPLALTWQLARRAAVDAGVSNTGNVLVDIDLHSAPQAAPRSTAAAAAREQQLQLHGASTSGELVPHGSGGGGAADVGVAEQVLCYELSAQALTDSTAASMGGTRGGSSGRDEAWWLPASGTPLGGLVRLGRAPGSLATVEVVLTPRTRGALLPPRLVLRGLGATQPLRVECGVAGSRESGSSGLVVIE